jgi:hypothetical protein
MLVYCKRSNLTMLNVAISSIHRPFVVVESIILVVVAVATAINQVNRSSLFAEVLRSSS